MQAFLYFYSLCLSAYDFRCPWSIIPSLGIRLLAIVETFALEQVIRMVAMPASEPCLLVVLKTVVIMLQAPLLCT